MRKFYIVGFALLLLFDTLGQSSFKLTAIHAQPLAADWDWISRVFTQPWVYIAIAGYIGAFFTWMMLLKKAPVGPAFAASHLEVVTVMLVSAFPFHVAGIIFLALAEKEIMETEKHSKDDEPC